MSDLAFSLPMWIAWVLAFTAPVPVLGAIWLLSRVVRRVSAWADRKIGEVLASPPSITDGFTDMGEQADTVVWLFGDERPRLTVIDGGEGTAA